MDTLIVLVISVVVGLISLLLFYATRKSTGSSEIEGGSSDHDIDTAELEKLQKKSDTAGSGKAKQQKAKMMKSKSGGKTDFKHPWLLTTLKGHGDQISSFDLSPNGKYAISTAEDRSMFLWTIKDIASKEVRSVRAGVEFDCARYVKFCPDNRSFITSLENSNGLRVFKFNKNDDGSVGKVQQALDDYPKTLSEELIAIGVDSAGNYIMTADRTTKIDILSLKGEKLTSVDTGTMKNSDACVSPCGRFVAVCGFTPDVRVWEVSFDKARYFKGMKRAFDLTGHKAGVLALAFAPDSSRMVTVSKDSTWKLWKTDVEYSRGQDPSLLHSGALAEVNDKVKVAVSTEGKSVAIGLGNNITFYNCVTYQQDEVIKAAFTSRIKHMMFGMDGRYLYCCGDRNIKAFKNITGLRARIDSLNEQLKTCSKAMERRITDQLNEVRAELAAQGV